MVIPPPTQPTAPGMAPSVDPEQLLHMSLAVEEMLALQAELIMQPTYAKWYRPEDYKKPEAGKMLEKARQLQGEFAPVRDRIMDEIELARMSKSGVPKDYDRDEDDTWTDTAISGEIELIAYQLADSTLTFDAVARHRNEEDEAAKKVDFAVACMDHARSLHANAGNGNLELEKARTLLTTGRLAWHCTLNIDADSDEMPFIEHLVDPTSCFPVFEAHRGMRQMVRIYPTTVGDAIANFDDVDNTMYKKFLVDGVTNRKGVTKKRTENEYCEVIEYWDRRWRAVFIDGEIAREPMDHGYGFVPFVYKLSALGMPAYMRDPDSSTSSTHRAGQDALTHVFHNRDVAMPHKGVGLPTLLKKSTAQREAIYTTMLKVFSTSAEPPIVVEADEIAYPSGAPEVSRKKGDVSLLKAGHQQIQEIVTNANAGVLMPILQGVADNGARLSLPPTVHGLNDHSNVSGYATQGLNEAGRIKLVPWQRTLEDFERECMAIRFRMYRDWGWMVGDAAEGGEVGTIMIPRHEAAPGEDPMTELTPGDLKRAGVKINVSMSTMPLQMLGPVANALGIMMQLGIEDEIGALKKLNEPNPYKKLERIRMNKFYNDPKYLEAQGLKQLSEENPELAAYFMVQKLMEQQAEQQASQAPHGPPEGPPGMGAMGDSQAAMGQPPGPGTGPSGPIAPPDPYGTEA